MGLDWWWIIVVAGIATALLFPLLNGIPHVSIPRRPEVEGFDDSATGASYAEIQDRAEFKAMRRMFVKHIISGIDDGCDALDVLDLGCGTGHLIKDLHDEASRSGINMTMHGIDIGTASVRECSEHLAKVGLPGVDIKEGDGARMPFSDASMDIVVTSLSLHHWAHPEAVLAGIHKVLKPGGRMFLYDLRRDARRFFHTAFDRWFTPRMPEPLKSAGDPYRSLLSSYTPAEVTSMLERTPWSNEHVSIISKSVTMLVDAIKS